MQPLLSIAVVNRSTGDTTEFACEPMQSKHTYTQVTSFLGPIKRSVYIIYSAIRFLPLVKPYVIAGTGARYPKENRL